MTKIGQKLTRILGAFSLDIPLRGLSGVLLCGSRLCCHTLQTGTQNFQMQKTRPDLRNFQFHFEN